MSIKQIVKDLAEALHPIPKLWDGKEAILRMKESGSRQWRQMEWIGFYFEFLCHELLASKLDIPGPRYNNVGFDGFAEIPWDFKAHAVNTSSHQIIVNDSEAIANAIADHGSVGLILAVGEVEYNDEAQTFQQWHEELKGGPSSYTKKRMERGAWSRLRKTQFRLEEIHFIQINDATLVKLGSFQKNFRNSDGSPRRAKVLINLEKLNEEIVDTMRF